jgi:hypothetical protein
LLATTSRDHAISIQIESQTILVQMKKINWPYFICPASMEILCDVICWQTARSRNRRPESSGRGSEPGPPKPPAASVTGGLGGTEPASEPEPQGGGAEEAGQSWQERPQGRSPAQSWRAEAETGEPARWSGFGRGNPAGGAPPNR